MKKIELLAPCGNIDALYAAVSAKADAVYLSGVSFGARAFANNFTKEQLKTAVEYAHLHNVLVYVTINTIIKENEFDELRSFLAYLSKIHVDAVIVQDLGVVKLIKDEFKDIVVHASTQMNIFNEIGANNLLKMGISRVVLAREASIDDIKKILDTKIEVEVFAHGALCFSSSGNCLMSSVIGNRSGNRGKCAQPCRKNYSLFNNEGILVENKALLSMKDLMTLEHIDKLIETGIHSLKIEGRMKSKEYVYTVVSSYRKAIDSYYEKVKYSVDEETLYNIKLVFNREFTKGYLFNEYNKDIVNINTVNHQGVVIGKIVNRTNKFIDILLSKDISMHDGLRVNSFKPYGIFITNMIVNGNSVKAAKKGEVVRLFIENNSINGDEVVKTTDKTLENRVDELIKNDSYKVNLNLAISIFAGKPITLTGTINNSIKITVTGDVLEYSDKCLDETRIKEQLSKLNNTIFTPSKIDVYTDNNSFVRISSINALRRELVEKLYDKILSSYKYDTLSYHLNDNFNSYDKTIEFECVTSNLSQTKVCSEFGIKTIYDKDSYAPRITNLHNNETMVHNLGHINESKVISPYFNIINSNAIKVVETLGATKCYLSPEADMEDIKALNLKNLSIPVGVVLYGKIDLMVSKHCVVGKYSNALNKKCNSCLKNNYYLKDEYNNKFDLLLEKDNDCTMRVLSYKTINQIKFYNNLLNLGISKFLLIFTTETESEVRNILNKIVK